MTLKKLMLYLPLVPLFGCGHPSTLSQEELTRYIADESNGLTKTAAASGYAVQVTYRPTDLLVYQETDDLSVDSSTYSVLSDRYSKYYYFILSLSRNKKEALHQMPESSVEYSELVQTLSFRMNQYVSLTTATRDTIPVADFLLNRTYGLSTSTDVLFVFDKKKALGKEWVQFNLNEFGLGAGNMQFRFIVKDLEDAPGLNFVHLKM